MINSSTRHRKAARSAWLLILGALLATPTVAAKAGDPAAGATAKGTSKAGLTAASVDGENALFHEADGQCGLNLDHTVGWRFDVVEEIEVCALQWYDEDGSGLSVNHEVGIWDPSGALLTSVVIPAGTSATLVGNWRSVEIPAVTLPVATGYTVGGFNGSAATECLHANVTQLVHPKIQFVDAVFSDNARFECPRTPSGGAQNGFYGCSFQIGVPADCPIETLVEQAPFPLGQFTPAQSLKIARRFRDVVLRKTPEGRELVRQYYRHSAEIGRILLTHPELMVESYHVFVASLPSIEAACQNGGRLALSTDLYRRGRNLLDQLAAEASPEARAALEQSQRFAARIQPSDAIVVQPDTAPSRHRSAMLFCGLAVALIGGLRIRRRR